MKTFLTNIIGMLCGAVVTTSIAFLITQEFGWFIAQIILLATQMILEGIFFWRIRR